MRATIPHYALYGDQAGTGWSNTFNFEWIPERSSLHNWEIKPHVHDAFVQILYLQAGSGEVILNHARWAMQSPCLVLIPAQHVHGFHFSSDVDGPVVTAAQNPLETLAQTLMPELTHVLRKPALFALDDSSRHADALMPLFHAIERERRMHDLGHVALGMSLLAALLVQIARIASALEPQQTTASRKAQQVEKFRTAVDAQFRQHLPLAHYASQLGITTGQLSRVCREMLGVSALDVLHSRIVHEAQRDLVYSSLSIKQVAASMGFMDEAYFGRFFRKHTRLSPKEFRLQARNQMRPSL